MQILYTATSTASGGRNGHVQTDDGVVSLDLAIPQQMGGPGGAKTNPEQLFASGYAACFDSALQHVARLQKIHLTSTGVTAHVGIGPNDTGGFALDVKLDVTITGIDREAAEKLIDQTHHVCPYSNAIRGNVNVVTNLL